MPLYEYKCEKCGVEFEKMRKFSDEPLTEHEGCGGSVRRLMTAPTFQFKGTGWYITDYAHGKSGSNGSGKNAPPKSESSPSKSDSTPAASTSKPSSDK